MLVRPDNILITNSGANIRNCHAHNSHYGLILGYREPSPPGFLAIERISRYPGDGTTALQFEEESQAREGGE